MPVFEHVSTYPHPRSEVWAWHSRHDAFTRLSPPATSVIVDPVSHDENQVGSVITLRMSGPLLTAFLPDVRLPNFGRGPVGLPWRLRLVEYDEGERFTDEQVSGPFGSWRHEHIFSDGPEGGTTIVDRVAWEPPVIARPAAALITRELTRTFAFRDRQLHNDLDFHARLGAVPSHVVIAGASGLIGTQLSALLTSGGHRVTRLTRGRPRSPFDVTWDPASRRLDPRVLEGVDAVVNLAGATIAGRFTQRHKDDIVNSRLDSTAALAGALAEADGPRTLVQGSAIGIYGPRRPGELLTEESAPGPGFLAQAVVRWEDAASPALDAGVRTAFMRTGMVLSGGGGVLLPQLPLFAIGAGGRLTAPDAYLSWIGLDDTARAFAHAVFTSAVEGPVNVVAPHPVTTAAFARTLGRVLHRPSAIPTPAFGPKLVLGREGAEELVRTDQRVSSARLEDSGFRFYQPTLDAALRHALLRE